MPPTIGHLFPDEERKAFAKRSVQSGTVLRFHRSDTSPPKIKRLIVLGVVKDGDSQHQIVGYVYINSNPNPRANDMFLRAEGRTYLEHDSYVGLIDIYEDSFDTFVSSITREPACVIGKLSSSDMAYLSKAIQDSRTIPKKMKIKFGFL